VKRLQLHPAVYLSFLLFLISPFTDAVQGQEPPAGDGLREQAPRVFFDCDRCDFSYVRGEIPFVSWVRDREDAVLHLLITDQRTASGGREYNLDFIGLKRFAGTEESLRYVSPPDYTDDETRQGLVGIIKIGLLPYLAGTPLLSRMSVSYDEPEEAEIEAASADDPWDSWVFEIEGWTWGEKQASQSELSLDGSISADRVTEEWRIRTRIMGEYEEERFENGNTSIKSSSHERRFWGLIVKSLGNHWSAGVESRIYSSTYDNTDLSMRLAPAVEYSLFDYAETERRSLTFAYRIGYKSISYREETIYDKMSEHLFDQSLDIDLRLTQPWGSARVSLEGSHYFHDLEFYRVDLFSRLSLRLIRGLSLNFFTSTERIHDQLHLPAGGATLEEILLRRQDLATTYDISFRLGLSYTFGSIYNNVVNTRL